VKIRRGELVSRNNKYSTITAGLDNWAVFFRPNVQNRKFIGHPGHREFHEHLVQYADTHAFGFVFVFERGKFERVIKVL
jgi:hypothetical protein